MQLRKVSVRRAIRAKHSDPRASIDERALALSVVNQTRRNIIATHLHAASDNNNVRYLPIFVVPVFKGLWGGRRKQVEVCLRHSEQQKSSRTRRLPEGKQPNQPFVDTQINLK
jgi:hypothetical protein